MDSKLVPRAPAPDGRTLNYPIFTHLQRAFHSRGILSLHSFCAAVHLCFKRDPFFPLAQPPSSRAHTPSNLAGGPFFYFPESTMQRAVTIYRLGESAQFIAEAICTRVVFGRTMSAGQKRLYEDAIVLAAEDAALVIEAAEAADAE